MKKIYTINGKDRLYNTETAQELASWTNEYSPSDFNWYGEDLYLKKTGEYFLYGYGGPASPYSKSVGMNSWSGDEEIRPLTYDEAKEWAKNHLEADEYMKLFGEVSEGDEEEEVILYVRTTPQVKQALDRKKADEHMTYSDILEELLGLN